MFEPTHSHLQCDALPNELPSPWEQAGGKEGYTSVYKCVQVLQECIISFMVRKWTYIQVDNTHRTLQNYLSHLMASHLLQ